MPVSAAADFGALFGMHAALHDAEQGTPGTCDEGLAAAGRPAHRPAHRYRRGGFVDAERRTLVEHHADVGVEQALEFDRALRRQPVPAAVDVTAELDPVLVDGPEFGERHQLIAAGVGGESGSASA